MTNPNRIDQLAPPPKLEPQPKWYEAPWMRRLALGAAGAAMAALCPFVPWPPVRAACVAVSTVVSLVPQPAETPTADK